MSKRTLEEYYPLALFYFLLCANQRHDKDASSAAQTPFRCRNAATLHHGNSILLQT